MPGGMEWVVILLVVVVLFGGKKIPELAKGLGKGIRNFKDEMKEDPGNKEEKTVQEEHLKQVSAEKKASPTEETHSSTTKQV